MFGFDIDYYEDCWEEITFDELVSRRDEEYESMSEDEKSKRAINADITFLEWLCSASQKYSKLWINEVTCDYKFRDEWKIS